MHSKGSVLLLLVAVTLTTFGCGHSYLKHKQKTSSYNDFLRDEVLDAEFNDVESGEVDVNADESENHVEDTKHGCAAVTKRNTDEYIDKVLEEVRPKIPEPAFLPERVGRLKLFNGTLENLASLKRTGPALARCTDSTFSFLVPIGFRNLTGRYFWEMDTGLPVFRGFIDMFIERAEADVLYTRQRGTGDGKSQKAVIEKFNIQRLEGVQVKFDGLGPMNRVASGLIRLVTRFFNRGVSRALEGPVKNAINRELKNVEKYEKYYF